MRTAAWHGGLTSLLLALACVAPATVTAAGVPPVRAITAFVELDPARYEEQFAQVAAVLRQAQAVFEQEGFTVQTLRITTQPFGQYIGGLDRGRALALMDRLAELSRQQQVLVNIGPAVLDDSPDPATLEILEQVQSRGSGLFASMIVAGEDGVHWNSVRAAARHVSHVAVRSPGGRGTLSFAATAMLGEGSPFFPGSWHTGRGGRFSVGLQSAGVVAEVLARAHGDAPRAQRELTEALGNYAQRVQRLAAQVAARTGWQYWGLDPTPAPMKEDSIGAAMEAFEPATLGSPGTLTAAYVITEAERQLPVTRVGYAGLMLPVLEDARIAQRWSEARIGLDSLLAYSSVCGTGLDTVPLPGDVTEEQLTRIIGDVAVLAYKWRKPLTARLQPVHGRKAGELTQFDDPTLVNAKLQSLQ